MSYFVALKLPGVGRRRSRKEAHVILHLPELPEANEAVFADLKQLTLTVGDGDAELLSDADLRLFAGVHYGLIGGNGVGK